MDERFNVFDVMHHGTHEKQLSNVFRWLLETEGSHRLGDRFLRIFIDEVNQGLVGREPFAVAAYLVLQEVNTSDAGEGEDIADLVLKNDDAAIVVENYFTSDGHGHNYDRYLRYSQRGGRHGGVVLLCRDQDSTLLETGWENASVVTYGRLLERLRLALEPDIRYQQSHPEAYSFINQMHRKFVMRSNRVEDHQILDFVVAMCATGEAGRYGEQRHMSAAEKFANEIAEQALIRFGDGRELLSRVKSRLRNFSAHTLKEQLEATYGNGAVNKVDPRYSGIYHWTVQLVLAIDNGGLATHNMQFKFGPSAWFANEKHSYWRRRVDAEVADYSRLFLTREETREIRQSQVSIKEVLDGLAPTDVRLHDEIVQLLNESQ